MRFLCLLVLGQAHQAIHYTHYGKEVKVLGSSQEWGVMYYEVQDEVWKVDFDPLQQFPYGPPTRIHLEESIASEGSVTKSPDSEWRFSVGYISEVPMTLPKERMALFSVLPHVEGFEVTVAISDDGITFRPHASGTQIVAVHDPDTLNYSGMVEVGLPDIVADGDRCTLISFDSMFGIVGVITWARTPESQCKYSPFGSRRFQDPSSIRTFKYMTLSFAGVDDLSFMESFALGDFMETTAVVLDGPKVSGRTWAEDEVTGIMLSVHNSTELVFDVLVNGDLTLKGQTVVSGEGLKYFPFDDIIRVASVDLIFAENDIAVAEWYIVTDWKEEELNLRGTNTVIGPGGHLHGNYAAPGTAALGTLVPLTLSSSSMSFAEGLDSFECAPHPSMLKPGPNTVLLTCPAYRNNGNPALRIKGALDGAIVIDINACLSLGILDGILFVEDGCNVTPAGDKTSAIPCDDTTPTYIDVIVDDHSIDGLVNFQCGHSSALSSPHSSNLNGPSVEVNIRPILGDFTLTANPLRRLDATKLINLELVILLDVSYSMKDKGGEIQELYERYIEEFCGPHCSEVQTIVGTFSDKPVAPFGHDISLDHCLYFPMHWDMDSVDLYEISQNTIRSGADLPEAQLEAIASLEDLLPSPHTFKVNVEVHRHLILFSDSAFHEEGQRPDAPPRSRGMANPCLDADYPSVQIAQDVMSDLFEKTTFVVAEDHAPAYVRLEGGDYVFDLRTWT